MEIEAEFCFVCCASVDGPVIDTRRSVCGSERSEQGTCQEPHSLHKVLRIRCGGAKKKINRLPRCVSSFAAFPKPTKKKKAMDLCANKRVFFASSHLTSIKPARTTGALRLVRVSTASDLGNASHDVGALLIRATYSKQKGSDTTARRGAAQRSLRMASKRAGEPSTTMAGPPTLPKVQIPAEHLQILLQRFESLLSSIVGLKEEIAMVPGMDEWPALLHRYTNLLSHAYSLSSSLLSASPHFLPSQLASFNKVLEAESENANLYADASDSNALFGGIMRGGLTNNASDDGVKATADGLPELNFYDRNNPLPLLLAHPVLPIPDENINFLGALLRTAPEAEILKEESALIQSYDASSVDDLHGDVDAQLERVQDEISQHDTLALRALRIWYHLRNAPDEEGNVLNVRERLPLADDGEADKDEQDEESGDDSDNDSEDGHEAKRTQLEQRQRRRMERSCWTADAVSAFLRGHPAVM